MAAMKREVWLADLGDTTGREQAGARPVLVLSEELTAIIIVCPISSTSRRIQSYVEIIPPEGGLDHTSVVMCDQVRAISTDRFGCRLGIVSQDTIVRVDNILRRILGL